MKSTVGGEKKVRRSKWDEKKTTTHDTRIKVKWTGEGRLREKKKKTI